MTKMILINKKTREEYKRNIIERVRVFFWKDDVLATLIPAIEAIDVGHPAADDALRALLGDRTDSLPGQRSTLPKSFDAPLLVCECCGGPAESLVRIFNEAEGEGTVDICEHCAAGALRLFAESR